MSQLLPSRVRRPTRRLRWPSGEQIVRGNVTFERDGNRTIIRASDGSIINYLNFNIGSGEIVRFIQPGDWARVLNRVTGNDPSVIAGTLKANGQVYIVNPAGVYFANGARRHSRSFRGRRQLDGRAAHQRR